jgi:hypothetical protein
LRCALFFLRTHRRSARHCKLEKRTFVTSTKRTQESPPKPTTTFCGRLLNDYSKPFECPCLQLTHSSHSSMTLSSTLWAGEGEASNTLALCSSHRERRVSITRELTTLQSAADRLLTDSGHHLESVLCGEGGNTLKHVRLKILVQMLMVYGHCREMWLSQREICSQTSHKSTTNLCN